MKPINEYSFVDFKSLILGASKNCNEWFFTQTATGYYANYRPKYPERTAADFTVALDFGVANPRMTIYRDTACLPTIKQHHSADDLSNDLRGME